MTELKTLKDFETFESRENICENVKLLHLKDNYEKDNFCGNCVHETQLKLLEIIKEEAIKWIKAINEHRKKRDNYLRERNVGGIDINISSYEQDDALPMINILKHFFNLTEEDLK